MIVLADLNVTGNAHVPVNSSLAMIFRNIFCDEEIMFFSEKKHNQYIEAECKFKNEKNFFYKARFYRSPKGRMKYLQQEFMELYNLFHLLLFCKKHKIRYLIIFCVMPITHFVLKKIIRFLNNNTKVIIFFHGELEYIREREKWIIQGLGWILKKAILKNTKEQIHYVVFGKSIRENLKKEICIDDKVLHVIDHPYLYQSCFVPKVINFSHLEMATIGIAATHKNTQWIFMLGNDLEKSIQKKQIKLSIIGKLDKSMFPYINEKINYIKKNCLIERKNFEILIKKIDYSLFFYDNQHYQLCASGAFFDSVNFQKPIIALKNDFFLYYFNKLGNIGYLCDSYEEILDRILWILDKQPHNEYILQQQNLKKAKQIIGLKNIEKSIREIMMKIEI